MHVQIKSLKNKAVMQLCWSTKDCSFINQKAAMSLVNYLRISSLFTETHSSFLNLPEMYRYTSCCALVEDHQYLLNIKYFTLEQLKNNSKKKQPYDQNVFLVENISVHRFWKQTKKEDVIFNF